MYKKLFFPFEKDPLIQKNFYTLNDLVNFVCTDEYKDLLVMYAEKIPHFDPTFMINAIEVLSNKGLPTTKDKIFSNSNLSKIYKTEILDYRSSAYYEDPYLQLLSQVDTLAHQSNQLSFCDSEVLTTSDLQKKSSKIKIIDSLNRNYRYSEYCKYLEDLHGFGPLTVAANSHPNVIIVNKRSNEDKAITMDYCNTSDDPVLETNVNIVDVKPGAVLNAHEYVRLQAGQMNYTIYIVRENATLNLTRSTHCRSGAWSIFDSVLVCHPESTVNINTKNSGSYYSLENFYAHLTENVNISINGRNKVRKGNELHGEVCIESTSVNNECDINVKTVGNEYTKTSFVGSLDVSKESVNFKGSMENQNLMLSSTAQMHSRPILDIRTKEIECTHGCTISNIDTDGKYYLEAKGISSSEAESLLIESFLC